MLDASDRESSGAAPAAVAEVEAAAAPAEVAPEPAPAEAAVVDTGRWRGGAMRAKGGFRTRLRIAVFTESGRRESLQGSRSSEGWRGSWSVASEETEGERETEAQEQACPAKGWLSRSRCQKPTSLVLDGFFSFFSFVPFFFFSFFSFLFKVSMTI